MNTSLNHGTANIYQFPVARVRTAVARQREEAKSTVDLRICDAADGDGWYHDAAVQSDRASQS